ncbi:MAG: hypothetical protein ACR2QM_04450 [Longimicrobiales bacterium]
MRSRNKLMTWGLLGLFAFIGACGDSTGPDQPFSADAAAEDYAAMDAVVNSSAWDDFRTASQGFSFGGGSSVPSAFAQIVDGGLEGLRSGDGEQAARDIVNSIGDLDISGQSIISETHRGVVFVYDEIVEDYVASELTGAPATGVRFVLYELDGSEVPIVANEIGFVDLIDEGDDIQPIALRLSATANDINFLDYRVELENPDGPGSGSVMVDGFLRNDVDQLDFSIDVASSATPGVETLDITFDASIDNRGFDIAMMMTGVDDDTGETADVTLTVTHGVHSMAVVANVTQGVMDGTISLNGDLFATMTGDPDDPTFTSASGTGLTAGEIAMLIRVAGVTESVFTLFGELLEPAMHIVLLGLVL